MVHATGLFADFEEGTEVDENRCDGLRQRGGEHQTKKRVNQSLIRLALKKDRAYAMKMENRLTCRPATELGALKKVNPMLQEVGQLA